MLLLSTLYLVLDDGIVKAVHLVALRIVVLHLQDVELGSVSGSAPSPAPGGAQLPATAYGTVSKLRRESTARDLASLSRVFMSRRYLVLHSVMKMVRAVGSRGLCQQVPAAPQPSTAPPHPNPPTHSGRGSYTQR